MPGHADLKVRVMLAHVNVVAANRDGFSGVYRSPMLATMVRDVVARGAK